VTVPRRTPTPPARRSCSCGAGTIIAGADTQAVTTLLADFDRAHSGPGHSPVHRALSDEGRTPRKKTVR
jgi:hypothetical protein